jgi:fatty acid desaturase
MIASTLSEDKGTRLVSAKDLQASVQDLQTTEPLRGIVKTIILAGSSLAFIASAMTAGSQATSFFWACLAGLMFGAWIITTHDAIHHTLSGIRWFDEVIPRMFSFPVIWVHGTYSEIHKLHHKMNGDDVTDPERVQWTQEEYDQASALGRFYVRHQWAFDIFLFGGIGLIYKTVSQGVKFYSRSKGLRRQMWLDLAGILAANGLVYTIAIAHGVGLRWAICWFTMERVGGGIMQWRAHIEHYGLWGKGRHYFETQAYNCRNIRTDRLTSWYFNHLNFHSVHHAFPRVPFYKLEAAHKRFMELYGSPGVEPLIQVEGYLKSSLALARAPKVIGPVDGSSLHGARQMLPVR